MLGDDGAREPERDRVVHHNRSPQNDTAAILVTENRGRACAFLNRRMVRGPTGPRELPVALEFEAE